MNPLSKLRELTARVPFGFKIFGAFAALILIALTLVYLFTNNVVFSRFQDFNREQRIRQVRNLGPLFERQLNFTRGDLQVFSIMAREIARQDPQLGQNLVLADPDGTIVAAADESLVGQPINASTFREIASIRLDGQPWGTLLLGPGFSEPTPLEIGFLNGINRSILIAGLIAALIGLGIALWLTRQITHPLRQLASASTKISQGELEQRVEIRSPDALGQLGDAFNTMSGKLSRSEKLRRNMIADIAHELRTPLTLVQGNLQAILDGIYPPDQEKIASIHEKSLLLSRLVRDLQELSLAEAGELPLDREVVDLNTLAQGVAETIEPQLRERRIELSLDFSSGDLTASVDASRISQVLLNLLGNSLRYTPEGGKICVKAWRDAYNFFIRVSDTGPGIPEKDLDNVFDRFWRGDASRARHSGGSGLGLAVAKQWVESHGGRIWVESPPGSGASFSISLPIQPEMIDGEGVSSTDSGSGAS